MTLFGIIWTRMQEAGEAPRESYFAEHSAEWFAAREECQRRVDEEKASRGKA